MESKRTHIFNKPVTEIIRKRISIRNYEPKALEESLKNELEKYLEELDGPFSGNTRYKLVDTKAALDSDIKLGTYGIIRGVSTFVATAAKQGEMNLEELGYKLEKFILFATSKGLGTCWLGGTFKKGEFAKAINIEEGELLPIVTPIGYPSKSKGIVGSLMRTLAGSNNRKPWGDIFFNGSFDKGLSTEEAGVYAEALEMVRIAPSASNKQPWRIVKDKDTLHFYLNHAKGYSSALGFDMQRIDIGIAMCHLDLVLKEEGIEGTWKKVNPGIKSLDESTEYIVSWIR